MTIIRLTARKAAAVGAVAAATLAGGIAVAAWSTDGAGPGEARALSAQVLTVTAATGIADLYPGFADGDVHFSVANANPYAVRLTAMTPGTVTSSIPGCAASNVTVDAVASGLSLVVPAGGSFGPTTIPDVVSMAAGAPDACQGAVFTVELTLTGAQVS
jgi:hypothetical protein